MPDATCWLDCPNCDGQIKVAFIAHEGEKAVYYPSDQAYPGSPGWAEIVDVREHFPDTDCRIEDLTDVQLDLLEESEQNQMLEEVRV